MIDEMAKLLQGLSDRKFSGTRSELSYRAYSGLMGILRSVYGDNAVKVVASFFQIDEETGAYYCLPYGDDEPSVAEAFLLCLTGKG